MKRVDPNTVAHRKTLRRRDEFASVATYLAEMIGWDLVWYWTFVVNWELGQSDERR